jgi:hypothetical protein
MRCKRDKVSATYAGSEEKARVMAGANNKDDINELRQVQRIVVDNTAYKWQMPSIALPTSAILLESVYILIPILWLNKCISKMHL